MKSEIMSGMGTDDVTACEDPSGSEPFGEEQSAAGLSSGARQREILDAALDCVISIDDRGRITYFNKSAERTFGYQASEAIGRDLAAAIIPPGLRDAHRRGLAQYLETGETKILGRRLELTAMRADGSEFPAELTVTKIEAPGRPAFIGFVRDITERLQAEEELRSARDRLESVAAEQASLRRVATLVAQQTTPDELFAAVAQEVARVLGVRSISVIRYDPGDTMTSVGVSGKLAQFMLGVSWPLDQTPIAHVIRRTRQSATVDLATSDTALAVQLVSRGLRVVTGVPIVVDGRLWGAMLAHERDRDALPLGTVNRLQSFTELVATAVANATARSELVAAQRRVIAAADAERARLTRDIHDGAQQQLVNTLMNIQLALQKRSSNPERAGELLELAAAYAMDGIESLRELAAGIHPAILSDRGLAAALDALAARLSIPVRLEGVDLHLPATLESSIYFFCSEALTNVIKHAAASYASVTVAISDGRLMVEVRDDGIGGALAGSGGSGLVGLRDRIAALEGTLELSGPDGGPGTTLTARIPLPD
jgi:PAS domain S-box-containing protein